MSSIGDEVIAAFVGELQKMAFSPRVSSMLGNAGALGGVGLVAGGVLGAGHQAVKNYRESRDAGAGVGDSLLSGAMAAPSGATRGAAIGGSLGAVAGAGAGAMMSPERAESFRQAVSRAPSALGMGARFSQRQVHSATGWMPGAEGDSIKNRLGQIGMGSSLQQRGLDAAKHNVISHSLAEMNGTPLKPGLVNRVMGRTGLQAAEGRLDLAQKGMNAAEAAENRGLTNIPGYAGALKEDFQKGKLLSRDGAIATAVQSNLAGQSNFGKAVAIGLPAVAAANELRKDEDETGQGRGRIRRAGGQLVGAGAQMAFSPMSGMANQALTGMVSRPFKGKGVVMAPAAPDLTSDSGQSVPGERVVSERAAGSLGEGSPS